MIEPLRHCYTSYTAMDGSFRYAYPSRFCAPGMYYGIFVQSWPWMDKKSTTVKPMAVITVAQPQRKGKTLDDFVWSWVTQPKPQHPWFGGRIGYHFTNALLDSQHAIRAELLWHAPQQDGSVRRFQTSQVITFRPDDTRACIVGCSVLECFSHDVMPEFDRLLKSFHMNGEQTLDPATHMITTTFGKVNVVVEHPDSWRKSYNQAAAEHLAIHEFDSLPSCLFWMQLEPGAARVKTLEEFACEKDAYPDSDTLILKEERRIIMNEQAIVHTVCTTPNCNARGPAIGMGRGLHVHLFHEEDGYRFVSAAGYKQYYQFESQVEYILDHMKFWHHRHSEEEQSIKRNMRANKQEKHDNQGGRLCNH